MTTKRPKPPKIIVVGDVRVRPHRPPTTTDKRWSWRAFRGREFVWSGRGTPDQVTRAVMVKIAEEMDAPEAAPARRGGVEAVIVRDVLELYLAEAEARMEEGQLRPMTFRSYESEIKQLDTHLGLVQLHRLGPAAEGYKRRQLRAGRASASVAQQLTILKLAFRWCAERGYAVADEPSWPKVKVTAKWEKFTPTKQEVRQLYDALEPRDPSDPWERDLLLFFVSTGARRSEATGFGPLDFDAKGRHVELNGKTGRRLVPVQGQCLQMLRERSLRIANSAESFWGARSRPLEWARNQLQKARVSVGLPRLTPHSLRRHFCTELIDAGVTPKDYERLTGHSFQVGMNVYVESRSANRRSAIELAGLGDLWAEEG